MATEMTQTGYPIPVTEHTVHANGIDIWYCEAGEGIPLLLLHGGLSSNGPLWTATPGSWGTYLDRFAAHFRVLMPDTRGHGRTRNPAGTALSYPLYAEDLLALIDVLGLRQPLICGFSDGGVIATLIGMLAPDVPRALVDWAGHSMFHPDVEAPIYRLIRTFLGGSPEAMQADYEYLLRQSPWADVLSYSIADFEPVQGAGYVRTHVEQIFEFWSKPMAYTFADYPRITTPMLMIFGDRDFSCSVAEGAEVFARLPRGELGIIPGSDHELTPRGVHMVLDYLLRHCDDSITDSDYFKELQAQVRKLRHPLQASDTMGSDYLRTPEPPTDSG